MATPFVELQRLVFRVLVIISTGRPNFLRELVMKCREDPKRHLPEEYLLALSSFGLQVGKSYWAQDELPGILLEQIDDSGPEIRIRNILGMKLNNVDGPILSIAQYAKSKGNGDNRLRTTRFSQPAALKVGDILASGCRVVSEPREGGNGSILIHLTGGRDGHWIDVPARIPVALLAWEDQAPLGYAE